MAAAPAGSRHPNLWPPFTQLATAAPAQRIVSGEGALLFRDGAPPLIDAISSWWVTLHGHGHPSWLQRLPSRRIGWSR